MRSGRRNYGSLSNMDSQQTREISNIEVGDCTDGESINKK